VSEYDNVINGSTVALWRGIVREGQGSGVTEVNENNRVNERDWEYSDKVARSDGDIVVCTSVVTLNNGGRKVDDKPVSLSAIKITGNYS